MSLALLEYYGIGISQEVSANARYNPLADQLTVSAKCQFNQQFIFLINHPYSRQNTGIDTVRYLPPQTEKWIIAYRRFLSNQFQLHLGVSCELSSKQWDIYDRADGPRTKRIPAFRFCLLPGVDYSLLNQQRTKIWLTGQAGVQWLHRGLGNRIRHTWCGGNRYCLFFLKRE